MAMNQLLMAAAAAQAQQQQAQLLAGLGAATAAAAPGATAQPGQEQWTPEAMWQALQALGAVPTGQTSQQQLQLAQQGYASQAGYQQLQAAAGMYSPATGVTVPGGEGAVNFNKGKGGGKSSWKSKPQENAADVQRRQMELQAKRSEETMLRDQHRAALIVRKQIQRIKLARADNFEELRLELEATQAAHMAMMGTLAEKVNQEAEKAIMEAHGKVTAEYEKQIEEERKKLEDEMQAREEEARIETMADDAGLEVTEVETKVNHAEELAKPLSNPPTSTESAEGLYEAAIVTEEAIETAQADLNRVGQSMKEMWNSCSKKGGNVAAQKLGPEFRSLNARLAVCRRTIAKIQETTKAVKDRVGKQVMAAKKDREAKEAFAKHDADGDGKLNREEIVSFAQMEHQLDLSMVQLDGILKRLATGGGVTLAKLPALTQALQQVRAEEEQRVKRESDALEKAALEEALKGYRAQVAVANNLLTEAEKAEDNARKIAQPLGTKKTDVMDGNALLLMAAEADEAASTATPNVEKALERINELDAEAKADNSKDMGQTKKQEVVKLRGRVRKIQDKISQTAAVADNARRLAQRKSYIDIARVRNEIILGAHSQMVAKRFSVDDLFNEACGRASRGGMQRQQFASFVHGLPGIQIEESTMGSIFEHVTEGGSFITSAKFADFMSLHLKVTRSTMLTETQAINSKVALRLEPGETLLLLEGPIQEEKVGLKRIRCRAVNKNVEGWATMSGNQGTVFLKPTGIFYHCVKEADMTDVLTVKGSTTMRNLEVGEVVAALGPEEKETSIGVRRLKCKAVMDGSVGYVTLAGNSGIVFFLEC